LASSGSRMCRLYPSTSPAWSTDDALIHELLAYSAKTLLSGLIQYGAPPGSHDDLVMALMLAWEGSRFVLTREQWRALQRAYGW